MSFFSRWRTRADDEQGIIILLFALLLVAMMILAGLVLDYGLVRTDRQDNKRAADTAAAAGTRALESRDGVPRPWQGVCEAYDYLTANHTQLGGLTGTWQDQVAPTPSEYADPCADTADEPYVTACDPDDKATWAWFAGSTDGGRIEVDIKSGYDLADGNFADEALTSGDEGDPDQAGCDQLAVIITEKERPGFGAVASDSDIKSRIRSVGRVTIGTDLEASVALLLLEQQDCATLDVGGGGNSGEIVVFGSGQRPGIIHADSAGQTSCGNDKVINSRYKNKPLVRTEAAPLDSSIHGVISTFAASLGGNNAANATTAWTDDRTSSTIWMCDNTPIIVPTCTTGPTSGDLVTRTPGDKAYYADVAALRTEADLIFLDAADGTLNNYAGYSKYTTDLGGNCNGQNNSTLNITATKVFFDCPGQVSFGNNQVVNLTGSGIHVVAQGGIVLGAGSTLNIQDPRKIYVVGQSGNNNPPGVESKGTLLINQGSTATSCAQRAATAPTLNAEMVIKSGPLVGGAQGTLRMCQTFVHLMGNGSLADLAGQQYPTPMNNTQNGFVDVGGGGNIQWTAPNTTPNPPDETTYVFEDLALWTETSAASTLSGNGGMALKGVFFMPNANPVKITGTTADTIDADAQFWARKLSHNGNALLHMTANPNDSIPIPFFESFALVR